MRVAHEELLSIGRFAQLAGLTAKALRHYDELGLLRPAYVDDFTGYRWYSLEQARDAVAIRRLRAFELPLDEIAEVLRGGDALLRERLTVQRARLQGRAVVTERMIDELDRLLRGEEELVPVRSLDYRVQDVPELVLAAIHRPARLGELPIPELICETGKWSFAQDRVPGAPVAICPADDDGMVDLRVGWPVRGTVEPPAPIELVVCSAGRAVVHTFVGDFMALCDEWRLLWESLQRDGIRPGGEPREHYETSPEEVNDPSEHVTRLVWPLEPKEE
ncbi:MAG: MerR family transcriptional regulator [Actinomycetota bacterium]|nr:MerR family transcriptional regulator [Actinomycetota bacterium]